MDEPFWKRFNAQKKAFFALGLWSCKYIIEVTVAEKKSSSHPSAEVSFQSKRKKRESREAPPPLLRLLSGQPSSKTYALLRNGLTVITLLKVLDWVASIVMGKSFFLVSTCSLGKTYGLCLLDGLLQNIEVNCEENLIFPDSFVPTDAGWLMVGETVSRQTKMCWL